MGCIVGVAAVDGSDRITWLIDLIELGKSINRTHSHCFDFRQMLMSALEEYLRELRDIRSSGAGVPETSYYTPLANLLNEVGKPLKLRVKAILQLANRGAGHPDGGLFTKEQLKAADNSKPLMGQSPNRGVIEVKPASDDAWVTADGPQVSQY